MPELHAERRNRLRARLIDHGLDAVLVTSLVNVRYLTGFTGSNAALLVWADPGSSGATDLFSTDGRYATQSDEQVPDVAHLIERECAPALAREVVAKRPTGTTELGFESHDVTVDLLQTLTEAADAATLRTVERAVERLRIVKDEAEIEALRRACAIADRALAELIEAGGLRPGRTEREVGRDLDGRMLDLGAEAVSFETIVASGPNSAIPHHRPGERVLATGDFVKLDFGATYAGYHSDMTRTVVLGAPADWQREIYDLVAESQRLGREALGVGVEVSAVDAASRAVIDAAGHAERFGHGLGHGVGLEIHEAPTLSPRGTGKLEDRTPVTVEPGVYLPGRGGVRIEDTLVVRDRPADSSVGGAAAGAELLTMTTKDFLVI